MSLFLEIVVRGMFLFTVAGMFVVGMLFVGFASDGGPSPGATMFMAAVLFFTGASTIVGVTPRRYLFADTLVSRLIWGAFVLSVVLPLLVVAWILW